MSFTHCVRWTYLPQPLQRISGVRPPATLGCGKPSPSVTPGVQSAQHALSSWFGQITAHLSGAAALGARVPRAVALGSAAR
jgi:hypothetical protein